jgi:hypothetical protein
MESRTLFQVALFALRQGSGIHTRRKVVAKSVYRGIITCATNNKEQLLTALLRQLVGPSLRRAVTAWKHESQAAASPIFIVPDHICHV